MATVQGYGVAVGIENMSNSQGIQAVMDPGMFFRLVTVITLVSGTLFLVWLGEQITQRGIGNGISLIIFAGIVAEIPRALVTTFELGRTGAVSTLMILALFVLLILTVKCGWVGTRVSCSTRITQFRLGLPPMVTI